MLRYFKLSVLLMFLLGLMACPAPTTVTGRIPDLPGNMGDIINTGSAKFWSGRESGASDFITLSNEGNGSEWKIKISNPSNGQEKFCEYVTDAGANGSVGNDNKWSANFRLKKCESDAKGKQANTQHEEVLCLTMKFTSTRTAQVTLKKVNDVQNSTCPRYRDYQEFRMRSM